MHIYRSADWLRATALTYAQADLLPCDRLCEATIPPTWPIAFSLHYFEPLDIACFASGQPRSVSCIAWGQTPPPSDRLRLRLYSIHNNLALHTSGAADHSVCTSYTWGLLGGTDFLTATRAAPGHHGSIYVGSGMRLCTP